MFISVWEIITKSWNLYIKNLWLFLKYYLLPIIPVGALVVIAIMFFGLTGNYIGGGTKVALAVLFVIIAIAFIVAAIYVAFATMIALTRQIYNRYLGLPTIETWPSIKEAHPLIWRALGTNIAAAFLASWPILLSALILSGYAIINFTSSLSGSPSLLSKISNPSLALFLSFFGMIAFVGSIIYSIYKSITLGFAEKHTMIDGEKVGSALKASTMLVKNRWWEILWRSILPALFFGTIIFAISLTLEIFFPSTAGKFSIAGTVNMVLRIISYPLFTITEVILFAEAKKSLEPMVVVAPPAPMTTERI